MTANRIGGGVSKPSYAARFIAGALVGTGLRIGVWLVPDPAVAAVKRRL